MGAVRILLEKEAALAVGLFEAVVAVAVAFGLDLSGAQVAAMVGLLIPLGAFATRLLVWSEDSVDDAKQQAFDAGRRAASTDGPGPDGS